MKMFRFILLCLFVSALLSVQNCTDSDDKETNRDMVEKILQAESWEVSSVTIPINTATNNDDWIAFVVSFASPTMTTSGHAVGAEAVWPSGAYSIGEEGETIIRADGVIMHLTNLNNSSFTASFSVPEGTEIGGKIAALDGEYVFNME